MAKMFDFQLLADGAADGGAVASAADSLENNTGGEQLPEAADGNGSDAGNQESANGGVNTDPAAREREFEALIKGDFKEQFEGKVRSIVDRRFKSQRSALKEYEASKPVIDMLMQRYGISDVAALKEALEGDRDYWEAGAEKAGMGVEQFKEIMRLRAENERYRQDAEMTEHQRRIRELTEEWERQGNELKAVYPKFDLNAELANKDFQGLLKSGIPMQKAYELMHMDEIQAAIKEQTEKTVMDHIRANGKRPSENGIKNSNGFVLGKNVSEMTREDRAEIKRRVQRGEKIIL